MRRTRKEIEALGENYAKELLEKIKQFQTHEHLINESFLGGYDAGFADAKDCYRENWMDGYNQGLNFYKDKFRQLQSKVADAIKGNWNDYGDEHE